MLPTGSAIRSAMIETMTHDWTNATVDGIPLGIGFGVRFKREPRDLVADYGAAHKGLFIPDPPIEAWLTERDHRGEYQEVRQITPAAVIAGWTDKGDAFEFRDGLLTIRSIREDR